MIDALTFASPTPFSPFGVIAMWAIFAVALLAGFRRRSGLAPRTWRLAHMVLAVVIVASSTVHGLLIEGTMETMSKVALCALAIAAALKVMIDRRVWRKGMPSRGSSLPQPEVQRNEVLAPNARAGWWRRLGRWRTKPPKAMLLVAWVTVTGAPDCME